MKVKTGFRKIYHLLLLLIAVFMVNQATLAQSSQITASGVILDANKEPLIGVSVVVDGTTTGTITDFDGRFSLSCPQGSKLQVSYVGYKSQKLTANANMKITLQEDAKLLADFEVVAVGLGTMRKSDLTGAIASVSSENMKQGVVTSSEQLLQGKIAGLSIVQGSGDPTKGAQIRLRGGSSLSGENSPLVVVDGIAGVDMNTIPSADILSVDVLKDASASAIYGSRGANGVIIITTKRKDKESRSANYSGYFGVAKTSDKLELLNADQWNENRKVDFQLGDNTDWQEEVMQTAISQSHSITFSNVSKNGGFKGSLAYLNSEGVVKTSELERLGGSMSGFTNLLNDYVNVELGLSKTQDNYRDINGADEDDKQRRFFMTVYQANPTWPVYNTDGSLFLHNHPDVDAANMYNPLNYLLNHHDDRTRDRYMGYLKTDIWLFKNKQKGKENEGLKATINLSHNTVDTQERRYRTIVAQDDLEARPGLRGAAVRAYGNYKQEQFESYLTYDKSFNTTHRLNLMSGYSFVKDGSEGFGVGVRNFDYDDFLYNSLGAAKNIYIIKNNEAGTETFIPSGAEYAYSYKNQTKLASFFGRANYSFNSKYMITATIRADGSSKFGPKHKWGYFPSASLAWRVSQEQFMMGTEDWLDDLKLRAGYGVTGNQGGIDSYTSIATYKVPDVGRRLETETTDDQSVPSLVYVPTRNANEDLKWESTGQLNVGLDFSLWKNKLSGTIEGYSKKTTDLLYFYKVGTIMPVEYTLMNIGELRNTGVELSLNGTIMKTQNFSWTTNLNLAHNKNEFLGFVNPRFEDGVTLDMGLIQGPNGPYEGGSNNNYSQKLKKGYSVGSFFGAKTDGFDENGNLIYLKKDGSQTISTGDLTDEDRDNYLGSAMPKLNMALGMNFNYKNFDLNFSTIGVFGQKVYNATAMVLSTESEINNVLASSIGKSTAFCISDYWLEDASFFRIQNLTLGYTLDLKQKTKNAVSSMRIYATVENPIVFTSYSGVDPEVSLDMNVTEMDETRKVSPGIDNFNNYPKPRTFLCGVNIQF